MEYPRDFSESARARVELENIKAQQQLQSELKSARDFPSRMTLGPSAERAFDGYVLRVFLRFAEQACDLGRAGHWGVSRVRAESEEFLRLFTIMAFFQIGEDLDGRRLTSDPICSHSGQILPEVLRRFRSRDQWLRYQEQLAGLADSISQERVVVRNGHPSCEKPGTNRGKKPDAGVAARRCIVRANIALTTEQLCKRFEMERIVSPWPNFPGWIKGFRTDQYKQRICVMISKDKAAAREPR